VGIDPGSLISALLQSGPMGMLLAYVVWDKNCERRDRREEEARRAQIYKDDIEARIELARSLSGLTMIIQARQNV
jgi:hypothetical protein